MPQESSGDHIEISNSQADRDLIAKQVNHYYYPSSGPVSGPATGVVSAPPFAVVPRPELSDEAVDLLCGEQQGVAALIGFTGAGGFGKTTLATEVARDDRVTKRFPGGAWRVTLGEQAQGAELAGKINDLAARVSGTRVSYTDPEQAGQHLGEVLEGRECLLIVDDVWRASQLEPFLFGARSCRRLVTTRVREVLPTGTALVTVDAMTDDQAYKVLSEGLDSNGVDWEPLLARTGRWPVLLTLANRAVHRYVRSGSPAPNAVRRVAERLAAKGDGAL
ncbi:NB-ARC domain-containing protein [Saccharopolyspora shandongensis]|uniref:NB-ARC domain-containing protein n=1 Tax=Saccharopolyspora shandongensis TaxID=418495 RepID=UPI003420C6DD